MRLLNWINSQKKPEEAKTRLLTLLGRSESTITSYIYGYRKVPKVLADKINKFTNGEVTEDDLNEQFKSHQTTNSYVFASLKGQRVDKPLHTVQANPSIEEFESFVTSIKNSLGVVYG